MPHKNIEDKSFWYSFCRIIIGYFVHRSYRKVQYVGRENIPTDGAVILAPNHSNALMDALMVLYLNNGRKVFVARADIFNNKIFKKILTFLKIMPINRVRDGLRSVRKTAETVQKAIRILNNGVQFCILPEGTHRAMHSLLPIGKGIARVAYGANEVMGKEKPVYILPIGIEYGDYFRFRSTSIVHIGEAINVTQYINDNPDISEHNLMQGIRAQVTEALRSLIVWNKDDEFYPQAWEASKIVSGEICQYDLKGRFRANREMAAKLETLKQSHPEKAATLFEKVGAFLAERNKAKVSINVVGAKNRVVSALLSTLAVIAIFPLFVVMGAASFPVIGITEYAVSGLKDRAFHNSFRCVLVMVLWLLLYIAWGVVLFVQLPWYFALASVVVLLPAPMLVYDYFEIVRMCASRWRYAFNPSLKARYDEIRKMLKNI